MRAFRLRGPQIQTPTAYCIGIESGLLGRLQNLAANVHSMSADDIKGQINVASGFLKPKKKKTSRRRFIVGSSGIEDSYYDF